MDMPRNAFKHAIAAGRPQIGAWLMSGAPSTAEALGSLGFDFLVVDTEHVPIDVPQMIEILRAVAGTTGLARHARAVERHGDGEARDGRRRADDHVPVRAGRGRGAARGRGDALSAAGHPRRRRRAPREPLRHRAELPQGRQRRGLRRRADRDAGRARAPARDRRGRRRRRDLRRPGRPVRRDGPPGRHRARRRAGAARARGGGVQAHRQALRHRRAESGDGRALRRLRLHLGRRRLRHEHDGRPRAGVARPAARACARARPEDRRARTDFGCQTRV